jgi:hypothetical protein
MYPGIISAKNGDGHYIFYKHPALEYLRDVSVGDKITHINDIEIGEYYKDPNSKSLTKAERKELTKKKKNKGKDKKKKVLTPFTPNRYNTSWFDW